MVVVRVALLAAALAWEVTKAATAWPERDDRYLPAGPALLIDGHAAADGELGEDGAHQACGQVRARDDRELMCSRPSAPKASSMSCSARVG